MIYLYNWFINFVRRFSIFTQITGCEIQKTLNSAILTEFHKKYSHLRTKKMSWKKLSSKIRLSSQINSEEFVKLARVNVTWLINNNEYYLYTYRMKCVSQLYSIQKI